MENIFLTKVVGRSETTVQKDCKLNKRRKRIDLVVLKPKIF